MSEYTPFKMKGNPFTTGGVQGTESHISALKKKVDTEQYSGETQSSTANRNIRKDKQEKQRSYVEGIQTKLGETKKEKRAAKKIMNKSEKIRKREARQLEREKRTGKKEGKGVIGKIRKKGIDVTQKQTTKNINRQMDKLTDKQAFNIARRYVPGKTYTKGGKVYSEKTGSEVKDKKRTTDKGEDKNIIKQMGDLVKRSIDNLKTKKRKKTVWESKPEKDQKKKETLTGYQRGITGTKRAGE